MLKRDLLWHLKVTFYIHSVLGLEDISSSNSLIPNSYSLWFG